MSASVLKRIFKSSALFAMGSVSAFAYFQKKQIRQSYFHPKSELFQQMIEENELVESSVYKRFISLLSPHEFLSRGLNEKLQCFGLYTVYINKDLEQKLKELKVLTEEEKKEIKVYLFYSANSTCEFHFGVCHGGFTATLIDHTLGLLTGITNDYKPAATATLNIQYKKPIKLGREYVLIVEFDHNEEKKHFVKAKILDDKGIPCCEADSMFVAVNWFSSRWNKLVKEVKEHNP